MDRYKLIFILLITCLGLHAQGAYFFGGGGSGGSGSVSGTAPQIGVFSASTTVHSYSDFVWNESATSTGMTGMQIGQPEPNLSAGDGPSNSFGFASNATNLLQSYVSANVNTFGITQAYYISKGTVASPVNITAGASVLEQDNFVYLGGTWNLIGYAQSALNFPNGGEFVWDINNDTGSGIGEIDMLSPDGINTQLQLIGNLGTIGIMPAGAGIMQVNNGTPGTLAQVNMSTLNQPGVAFASLPSPSNGMSIYCTDCTVTSGIDDTCAASGTGANAKYIGGAWKCEQ